MLSFSLLLIAILPRLDRPVTERVDLVEVNHLFNEDGKPVLAQVIWYDWQRVRYSVVDWRKVGSPGILPYRDWESGGYVCFWLDYQTLRKVRAAEFRETWTQVGVAGDPEVNEREILPKERRRELRKLGVDK
jgi:hypothetical protein